MMTEHPPHRPDLRPRDGLAHGHAGHHEPPGRSALTDSAAALERLDTAAAERLIAADAAIDALDEQINLTAAGIIARRAPTARDLRLVLAVMRAAHSLERVGDLAKNLAKRTLPLSQSRQIDGATGTIRRMADRVASLLDQAMQRPDPPRCHAGRRGARPRPGHRPDVQHAVPVALTHMLENQANITAAMHLHFIAKNIERAGDHATAIAEQAIYLTTGTLPGEDRPKADATLQSTSPGS
jgi:phosphate transport system protein